MPLTRMGGAAFDLSEVTGVVPKKRGRQKGENGVTIFLRNAVSIELTGDEARAFLILIESLPPGGDYGPIGKRVAVSVDDDREPGQLPG